LQNRFLADIQDELAGRDAAIVSITTDPRRDDEPALRQYAREIGAGRDWYFLRGDFDYVRKVGSEFLGLPVEGEHHSSLIAVVDRWGNVRARVDWQQEGSKEFLLGLVDRLNREQVPVIPEVVVRYPAPEPAPAEPEPNEDAISEDGGAEEPGGKSP
jgi:cytochrome oxidase Cu insertion factor (SCO1/SenC/PrrC family)